MAEESHSESTDERTILVLHLARKREFLEQLATRIEKIRAVRDVEQLKQELSVLPTEIRSQIRSFDRLTDIERNVNKVTSALMRKLHRAYPDLTRTELLVCSYLRAGLTPGQAAEIMFVSRRAVEKHRQSIRTKLDLGTRIDLAHWLEDFEHGKLK